MCDNFERKGGKMLGVWQERRCIIHLELLKCNETINTYVYAQWLQRIHTNVVVRIIRKKICPVLHHRPYGLYQSITTSCDS